MGWENSRVEILKNYNLACAATGFFQCRKSNVLFANFPDQLGEGLDDKKPNLGQVTMSPNTQPESSLNILTETWQTSNTVSDNMNSCQI